MKVIHVILPLLIIFGACQSNTSKEKSCKNNSNCCAQSCEEESCCNNEKKCCKEDACFKEKKSCCEEKNAETKSEIQAYYFHYTKRCATCNAVEATAEEAIKTKLANYFNEGKISFTSLNLDEEASEEIAKSLNIDGQNLIIVKGDQQVNLTNSAFMNARSNPEVLEQEIVKVIETLLKDGSNS